jgi:glycosyltransferase involved in cell wall biosynthesis
MRENMNILAVHNRYQIRGGEDECYEAEVELLRSRGHAVAVYEETNDRIASLNPWQMASRTIWSRESYAAVRDRLHQEHSEILHVHNTFPLISPSIYYAAKQQGVAVVQTLHNYRLLCPNALFFRDGRVCEDCLGKGIPYPGILHSCYRNSLPASTVVAAMLSLHRAMRTWIEQVDVYIALTNFARQKFIASGIPAEKIVLKPNFVASDPGNGEGHGGYMLYVGRLSAEKGLDVVLKAWELLGHQIPLKIVGEGPLSALVAATADRMSQVEWLGRQPLPMVHELMGAATAVILPSKWYETFGRVAMEAFAKGTPVIASNLGAIAEVVEPERTGLHFQAGDAADLAATVEWLLAHPSQWTEMRQEARAEFLANYTAEKNYQTLLRIYTQVHRV